MPLLTRKEIRYLSASVLAITGAFSLRDISPGFFLQVLFLVTVSYGAHVAVHKFVSEKRGLDMRTEIWPTGIGMAVLSGILTGGIAVVCLPIKFMRRGDVEKRWMRKDSEMVGGEMGYVAMSGVLVNLWLGTLFLYLSGLLNLPWLAFGTLVNMWIAVSSLIPFPSLDGSRVVTWSGWMWGLSLVVASVGIVGYFVHP